ncbi:MULTISPECIES: hypothetical protein [unclassified Mesorhizobium]|uniref:hypothetical protein n=1 Tax=unclassified Mesorhizobium TaxID=325217 RepID=UPI001FE195BE|nr:MULTISPECIES: hypothetical protein [unclassified Mesorhizobium]
MRLRLGAAEQFAVEGQLVAVDLAATDGEMFRAGQRAGRLCHQIVHQQCLVFVAEGGDHAHAGHILR